MALIFIDRNATPAYICESTDIDETTLEGVSLKGSLVFSTDDSAWYIVTNLDTIAEYVLPVAFSGTVNVGTVDIDQTTPGDTNGVVVAESAAAPDGLGDFIAVLQAPGDVNSAPLSVFPYVFNETSWDKLRGDATNGLLVYGNMGRIASEVTPDPQASTNAETLVDGSILDTLHTLALSYTIENTGANSIDWIVYGGNADDLSDRVVVNASSTVASSGFDSYSVSVAPFRYYGVYVVATVPDNQGEATVLGITKG